MAISSRELKILIGAEVGNALKGFARVEGKLDKFARDTKRASNVWGGFLGGFAKLGLAVQGVRELTNVVGGAARGLARLGIETADEQAGLLRLHRAIINTGRVLDQELVASLDEFISSMERTRAVGDDQLRQALAVLVTETGDLATAQKRLALASDISATTGQDLVDVSRLLGKVDEDRLGGLTRLGLLTEKEAESLTSFSGAETLAARAGISVSQALALAAKGGSDADSVYRRYGATISTVIDEQKLFALVGRKVANQAVEFAKTPRGQMRLLNLEWRNLREDVGELVLPFLIRGTEFLSKVVRGLRYQVRLFSSSEVRTGLPTVRDLWKAAFGVEMPKSVQTFLDAIGSAAKRVSEFFTELGAGETRAPAFERLIEDLTPGARVTAAVKRFVEGVKEDVKLAFGSLGTFFDEMGPIGVAVKFALLGITISPFAGTVVSLVSDIAQTLSSAAGLLFFVSRLAPTGVGAALGLSLGLGLLLAIESADVRAAIAEFTGINLLKDQDFWKAALFGGAAGAGVTLGLGLAAGSLAITVPVGILIAAKILDVTGLPGAGATPTPPPPPPAGFPPGTSELPGGGLIPPPRRFAPPPQIGGLHRLRELAPLAPVSLSEEAILAAERKILAGAGFVSAQAGFRGLLDRPTMFMAHPGEHVAVTPRGGEPGLGPVVVNVNIGRVDSGERVEELRDAIFDTMTALGYGAA